MTEQPIDQSQPWQQLQSLAEKMNQSHLYDLFQADDQRAKQFSWSWQGALLDVSKQKINHTILHTLYELAREADLNNWISELRHGAQVNASEKQPALHFAVRQNLAQPLFCNPAINDDIGHELAKLQAFVEELHNGDYLGATGVAIDTVVNLGIGGSDLGPKLVHNALAAYQIAKIKVHFVANLDGDALHDVLRQLDPSRTLFLVTSKSFTTQETLCNADSARAWLRTQLGDNGLARHFVAVTAKGTLDNANHYARIFNFWQWIGGRFSLWSAVGLPIALALGWDNFKELLRGANAIDEHFFYTPIEQNLAIILAMIDIWNGNFLKATSRAVLPYSHRLTDLPRYLQQLEMESLGKQVSRSGRALTYRTGTVVWGEVGTNGQHSFYQLLHQGGQTIPTEFIALKDSMADPDGHQQKLLSHCLAQSRALMVGNIKPATTEQARQQQPAWRLLDGNRPSTTLIWPKIDPYYLGALLALYEHKVYVCATVWQINAFDQWAVELGKQMMREILPTLTTKANASSRPDGRWDGSTEQLLAFCHRRD